MNDAIYYLITSIMDLLVWDGELIGEGNLQEGPGVMVYNHMGALGPIGICCALPMRLYPWIQRETLDKDVAPDYVRLDFVEKELKLKPPLSMWVAKAISVISIPALRSIQPVPVYRTRQGMEKTFRLSLRLLLEGKVLLIAPEEPKLEPDPESGIRPFLRGFIHLGELYAEKTGKPLPFYPVIIHPVGVIVIEKPFCYDPNRDPRSERIRLINLLAHRIKTKYLELDETYATASQLSEEIIK